jgi:hypothetical protein
MRGLPSTSAGAETEGAEMEAAAAPQGATAGSGASAVGPGGGEGVGPRVARVVKAVRPVRVVEGQVAGREAKGEAA